MSFFFSIAPILVSFLRVYFKALQAFQFQRQNAKKIGAIKKPDENSFTKKQIIRKTPLQISWEPGWVFTTVLKSS